LHRIVRVPLASQKKKQGIPPVSSASYGVGDGTRLHFGFLGKPKYRFRSVKPSRATVHRTVASNCSSPSRIAKEKAGDTNGILCFLWQNYYKLIQCTALSINAPPVFARNLKDNRDRKDKIGAKVEGLQNLGKIYVK
jgi:hypothetical protein